MKYVDYDIVFQEVPDEISLALNISNCPNNCIGCHSGYLRKDIGNRLDTAVLQGIISDYGQHITCVCFMGGDADPEGIENLARWINRSYGGKYSVAWYSGKDSIPEWLDLSQFRYIKVGGYREQYGGLRSRTTNQRFYEVSGRSELIDRTCLFWT